MDGVYDGLGECISYGVVLSLNMTAMVALESASATAFSLPKMWNLWWPWRVHQLWGVLSLDMASMVALESASATGLSMTSWRVHQLWSCP